MLCMAEVLSVGWQRLLELFMCCCCLNLLCEQRLIEGLRTVERWWCVAGIQQAPVQHCVLGTLSTALQLLCFV